MTRQQYPQWAAKRARGNRLIGLVLLGVVVLITVLFVARYVVR